MTQSSIIPYLFLATFIIALAYGVMQFLKAKKAKREGHTSASARQGDDAGLKPGSTTTTTASAPAGAPKPPVVPR